MDNLRAAIKLIFGELCPDHVLAKKTDYLTKDLFVENSANRFLNHSLDEIQNVFQKLEEDWFYDIRKRKSKNIFNVLNHFNTQILVEDNLEPFVKFEHLLKWRDLSYNIGEDILTCSHLAYTDNLSQRNRDFFSWRPTIFSNNKRLKAILKKGVAENHFHLKGSGPVFDLSWLNLMNNITKHNKGFKDLVSETKLLTSFSNSFSTSKKDIQVLVYKAALIRLRLFNVLHGIDDSLNVNIEKPSNFEESHDLILKLNEINTQINVTKHFNGHEFRHRDGNIVIDYAIPKNIHIQNFKHSFVFYGERKLMYDCFKKIYNDDKLFKSYQALFHSYLLIKQTLRSELIQVNNKVGFGNFSRYQDRKEFFLDDQSVYYTAFVNLAVNDTHTHSNMQSFEVRVAPKEHYLSLNKSIASYNKILSKSALKSSKESIFSDNSDAGSGKEHFFTIHYIKKKDHFSASELLNFTTSRHQSLRESVKKQSVAIGKLRELNYDTSTQIFGIDSASNEFDAPPEVFAHGFRYLKNHRLSGRLNSFKENISEKGLGSTYHAGEDFYDVVDGMRAINEAICYLNLGQGDRIGHALALGIDVEEYYTFKNYKLMLPKQVVLDNIVWLLAKIRKFGISSFRAEVNRLEKLYENLFQEIYKTSFPDEMKFGAKYFHQTTYYEAWKLRGDDPSLYLDNLEDDIYQKVNLTYWERCRINHEYPLEKNLRNNLDVKFLYQQYHFNPKVKIEGRKIKQFNISSDYIALVDEVQYAMLADFKTKNISIECNPTSNYLIGTFRKYAKHPISRFFNLGLEVEPEKIKQSPQISVSINTDDQGIFSTSIENEYALLAISLEKEKDEFGKLKYPPTMIYDWLDRIRLMGLEQSFKL